MLLVNQVAGFFDEQFMNHFKKSPLESPRVVIFFGNGFDFFKNTLEGISKNTSMVSPTAIVFYHKLA